MIVARVLYRLNDQVFVAALSPCDQSFRQIADYVNLFA